MNLYSLSESQQTIKNVSHIMNVIINSVLSLWLTRPKKYEIHLEIGEKIYTITQSSYVYYLDQYTEIRQCCLTEMFSIRKQIFSLQKAEKMGYPQNSNYMYILM